MRRISLFFPYLVVAVMVLGFTSSCKDDDSDPTLAEIYVYDTSGAIISGASVRLYCTEEACILENTQETNSKGFSRHEFTHPAILAIEAIKVDTTIVEVGTPPNVSFVIQIDSVVGEGFVTIERNRTAVESVVAFPQ